MSLTTNTNNFVFVGYFVFVVFCVCGGERTHVSHKKHLIELREDRIYDCGCNSGSPLRDAVGFKNRTHPTLEKYIT